jgi:hypothetical protein
MKPIKRGKIKLYLFLPSLAGLAIFFSHRIFSNVCIDGDTFSYIRELVAARGRLSLLNSIALTGWFSKFHLIMFPLFYIFTGLCSLFDGWDPLLGIKALSLISVLGTYCLVFYLCDVAIKRPVIAAITSLMPFLTLGPSWMATTCDDNTVAAFFEILFIVALFRCCDALENDRGAERFRGFVAGAASGLSLGIHLKSIVSLPLVAAPLFIRSARRRKRCRAFLWLILGFAATFGSLYVVYMITCESAYPGAKTDFLVFHRQPGRFFFTRYESSLTDWLYFIYIGIRATLYSFQELYVYTNLLENDLPGNLLENDLPGPALIVCFFAVYGIAVFILRNRLLTKILFAFFLCHIVHSALYDSWVSERWDAIVIPVVITIGMCLDTIWGHPGRVPVRLLKGMIFALFAGLVITNYVQTKHLMNITTGDVPYEKPSKPWPYPKKAFFFFNHGEYYDFAGRLDEKFGPETYIVPLSLTHPASSHAVDYLRQYLNLYSCKYRSRRIKNLRDIAGLRKTGRLRKLLYIDEVKVPFYSEDKRKGVIFIGAESRTVFKGKQITLREMEISQDNE